MRRLPLVTATLCTLLLTLGTIAQPATAAQRAPIVDELRELLDVVGGDLFKIVTATAITPDQAWVGTTFAANVYVRNNVDVPLLLTLEVVPQVDVCGIASSTTQTDAAGTRMHEFLLMPNGTAEMALDLHGEGPVNGDKVSMSTTLRAKGAGECRLALVATLQLLNGFPDVLRAPEIRDEQGIRRIHDDEVPDAHRDDGLRGRDNHIPA